MLIVPATPRNYEIQKNKAMKKNMNINLAGQYGSSDIYAPKFVDYDFDSNKNIPNVTFGNKVNLQHNLNQATTSSFHPSTFFSTSLTNGN